MAFSRDLNKITNKGVGTKEKVVVLAAYLWIVRLKLECLLII